MDSLVQQNQWLQTELGRAQFAHQTDVEHAQELLSQQEAQSQANHRAMAAELEKRKTAFTEERRLEAERNETALRAKQKESNAAIRAEWIRSDEKQKELDTKWAAWVNQLQADQAKKQKDTNDELTRCITNLKQ